MPTPNSISSGPRSKVGLPSAGVAHDVSATPKLRACVVDLAARRGDLGKRAARLGLRAGDLLHEHGRAGAAAAGRVERVLDRDVVVREHGLDLDALVRGQLGGELEVEHVARVVLDDVHHAGAAVDGLRRGEHLVGHRGGEDRARAGGVEHAEPDEAAVQRLVPRAAARDERDLALHRGVPADDELVLEVDADEVGMRRRQAGERLGDDRPRGR